VHVFLGFVNFRAGFQGRAQMNHETNYNLYEAGMAQMDDAVGAIMKHLDDIGEADNTILVFTTDNGAEVFNWPDGGNTPFKGTKGMPTEGGFRVPCIARWPGHIKPGTIENGIFSGLDWFPTLVAAAGDPDISSKLLKGVKLGDRSYKNHLDGYNQLALLEGKGNSLTDPLAIRDGDQMAGAGRRGGGPGPQQRHLSGTNSFISRARGWVPFAWIT
jgi:arylsulfatase